MPIPPNPLVSVIIPAKNGASTIGKCLSSIAEQTHKNVEVLLIDSGSKDDTISIASQFRFVRILQIPPHAFNHGQTRNYGVSEAKGEFVLLTVQDAYASSNDWIEMMLMHFLLDKEVEGVCGQQVVPHDADKNPHEWFRPYSKPLPRVVQVKDKEQFKFMTPAELHKLCGWDNVNAMYRKSILVKYPFEAVSFGEDMSWAKTVVLNGKKIVYDYNCRVYHYHHSTYDYTYKRTLTVLYFIFKQFGFVREIKFTPLDFLKVIYRNIRYNSNPMWILFNWTRMRAAAQAYKDVMDKLKISEAVLDHYHLDRCGVPPQGKQNI